jgi:TPR repeat protein
MAEAYRWRLLAAAFTPDEKNASFVEWEKKTSMTIQEEGEYLARKTYDRWISDRIAVEDREISRYRKQAETGVVQAQLGLARAYELGRKVPRNLSIALAWYLVAGRNGSKEATEAASLLRKRMTAGQVAEASITADTLSR